MIDLYLKVTQTIMMIFGVMLILTGAATCEGSLYDLAIRMLWYGLAMLIGGIIIGKVREI